MSTFAQFAVGIGGVAMLMAAWCLVQQRWLTVFAPRQDDALGARSQLAPGSREQSNGGCATCSSPECYGKGGT